MTTETVTVPLKDYMGLTDGLLHLSTRRHGFTATCDRCLSLRSVLKGLVGIPDADWPSPGYLTPEPDPTDPDTHGGANE